MSPIAFAVVSFGALAGGFVSGLAGFGTALMALGIWLYVLPPSVVVPLVLISSIIAQTSTLPSIWRTIDFRLIWPFLLGGVAGVPLGTMLVAYADPGIFKLSVGVLLLVFPAALYLNRRPTAFSFGGPARKWQSHYRAKLLTQFGCPGPAPGCGPHRPAINRPRHAGTAPRPGDQAGLAAQAARLPCSRDANPGHTYDDWSGHHR